MSLSILTQPFISPPQKLCRPRYYIACVQYIDHFGNLVSNIEASYVQGKTWYVKAAGLTIAGCETYADVKVGDAIALIGSHGWVEIAINCGNAQLQLQMKLGDEVEVFLRHNNDKIPDFSKKSGI